MTASPLSKNTAVGVVGAGAMGRGIAQVAAAAGHPVLLQDAAAGQADKALGIIGQELDKRVARGRMTEADRQALLARITPVDSLAALAPAGLVIEAVVEDLAVKQQVFTTLEDACGADAILATNSSSLSPTAIARPLRHPERFLGMHFFNPAPVMKLVEIISGLATGDGVAAAAFATAAAWGKRPVYAAATPGFIVNRVARPFYAEAWRLLEEQAADAATVDAILKEAGGFPMGPFALMDLIGHDVNYAVTCSVFEAFFGEPRFRPSAAQRERVQGGYLGRKSGRGIYRYDADARPPAPHTAAPCPPPQRITVEGELGIAEALLPLFTAAGVTVARQPGAGVIRLEEGVLALTDGRPAVLRARGETAPLALFDLARDYEKTPRLALTGSGPEAARLLTAATGLFQAAGKAVSVIADSPGMVLMRVTAMLANEAAEAVQQGVATAAAVDAAMPDGLNYPEGPLGLADRVGPARLLTVLDNLAAWYGDGRHRASGLLRRAAAADTALLG